MHKPLFFLSAVCMGAVLPVWIFMSWVGGIVLMGSAVALVILARALGPLPKPIPDSEPEEGSELPEHLLNIQIPVGSGIPDTLCVMPNKTQELGPEDFSEVTQQLGLDTTHKETRFVTKKRQP